MGGTFDPIHNGHLVAASEVADLFDLDEVVFVPTGQPWLKGRQVSAGEDRYLMTVIATAANPRFSVSRVDIDRGGPTYTKDTLRDLHALNPDSDLYFITGADALASILSWQDLERTVRGGAVRRGQPARLRAGQRASRRRPRRVARGRVDAWSKSRRWQSRPPTAVGAPQKAGRCGT